jgi:hypothetical protein
MREDLTAIYYTSSHLEETNPYFLKNIEDQLLKALDGYPLIIVSQKPKMLGDNCTNICIGEVGRSHLNIYRQLMIGARAAKTKYVASVEDDILYSWEHFHCKRPSKDDVFLYDMNRWSIFTWSEPPIFSFRIGRKVVNALISPRDYIVSAMEERFAKFPDESKIDLSRWGDPGRYEERLGVTVRNTEEFYSNPPIIQFNHPEGYGFIRIPERKDTSRTRGTHKSLGALRAFEIPFWGRAEKILSYWGDNPRQ